MTKAEEFGVDEDWARKRKNAYINQQIASLYDEMSMYWRHREHYPRGSVQQKIYDNDIKKVNEKIRRLKARKNNTYKKGVELEELKKVPIPDILGSYGIEIKRGTFKIRQSEKTPSCKYYSDSNSWYDFGSSQGGSNIDLILAIEQCEISSAIRILTNHYSML